MQREALISYWTLFLVTTLCYPSWNCWKWTEPYFWWEHPTSPSNCRLSHWFLVSLRLLLSEILI